MRYLVLAFITAAVGVIIFSLNADVEQNKSIGLRANSGIHGYIYWADSCSTASNVTVKCRDTLEVVYQGNSGTASPNDWYLASKDYPRARSADFYIPYNNRYYVKGEKQVVGGTWYSDWYGPIDYNQQNEYPEQDIYLTHFQPGK